MSASITATRPTSRRLPRSLIVLGCAAVVVLACGAFSTLRASRTPQPAPTAPAPLAPPPRVHAIGRLEPGGTIIRLAAPTAVDGARIERLAVNEGDTVAQGQLIAILDTASRRDVAVLEAEARVESARARLEQIRAGAKASELAAQTAAVARAEAALRTAERDRQRTEALANRGVATPESLDNTRLRHESARLNVEQARATLASLTEIREVDVRLQEQEIRAAEATVERARADREATRVVSPIAGRVLRIHARPGERVADNGIAEIGATHQMHAVAEVYEADVSRVRVGQAATVRLPSVDLSLAGRVDQIGLLVARKDILDNDPVSDTDARVVEVRIELEPADGQKVAGLSNARVDVTIDVD